MGTAVQLEDTDIYSDVNTQDFVQDMREYGVGQALSSDVRSDPLIACASSSRQIDLGMMPRGAEQHLCQHCKAQGCSSYTHHLAVQVQNTRASMLAYSNAAILNIVAQHQHAVTPAGRWSGR